MEEDKRTPEEVYRSAVDATVVHFFSLAASYRARGRRLGLSYGRIWTAYHELFDAVYHADRRAGTLRLFPTHEGVMDACEALARTLTAPLEGRFGVAYFDDIAHLWMQRVHTLKPDFYSGNELKLTGYPKMLPETLHLRMNKAMAEVPMFLLDLNGVTVRQHDIDTLRARTKHAAAAHLTIQELHYAADYYHGVEIAMFCVEQIIAEHGSMSAQQLLELLEERLEDFWVPQYGPQRGKTPFDAADYLHVNPGHWPKLSYNLGR